MFDHFNESARKALFYARYEASRLGDEVIDSKHILLGILREGDAVTTRLLRELNVRTDAILTRYSDAASPVSPSWCMARSPLVATRHPTRNDLTHARRRADR
ncbi:MAG TPA: Clp protease N-terminal domain-containing protein [Vicinamibacterales bacterium]|nr:Clp protease N-terminal domain-containing protein [Vicinamibacterales bacterium]